MKKTLFFIILILSIVILTGCKDKDLENLENLGTGMIGYEKHLETGFDECNYCKENITIPIIGWSDIQGSFSSNCPCKTATPILADGRYNCSGKYTTTPDLPNERIKGTIHEIYYEIDKSLLIELSNKTKFPIVCGDKHEDRFDDYGWYDRNPYLDGELCPSLGGTYVGDKLIYCCVDKYCASWGISVTYYNCTCDNRYLEEERE